MVQWKEVDWLKLSCLRKKLCDTHDRENIFTTTQFPALKCFGPYIKQHGVRGLSRNYHLWLYPKLGCCNCIIWQINCSYVEHIGQSPWTWFIIRLTTAIPTYYWLRILACVRSFKQLEQNKIYQETKLSEDFDDIQKVVIYNIIVAVC